MDGEAVPCKEATKRHVQELLGAPGCGAVKGQRCKLLEPRRGSPAGAPVLREGPAPGCRSASTSPPPCGAAAGARRLQSAEALVSRRARGRCCALLCSALLRSAWDAAVELLLLLQLQVAPLGKARLGRGRLGRASPAGEAGSCHSGAYKSQAPWLGGPSFSPHSTPPHRAFCEPHSLHWRGSGAAREPRPPLRQRFQHPLNSVAAAEELDGAKFLVLRKQHLLQGGCGRVQMTTPPASGRPCALQEEPQEGSSAPVAGSGVSVHLPDQESQAMPVSELKSLFQRGGVEAPKAPGAQEAPKASPQKPCMLPVRCVPPPSCGTRETKELSPEQEQPENKDWLQVGPSAPTLPRSPYSKRRQLDEAGSCSPYLKRVPKSQKMGEEAVYATTVPLEAAEHEWLVKATSGQWSQQLHGLLLTDKTLAGKRDFMSGSTVLHWAAKSGNCDMVRKVIEVAKKGGVHVNVNVKSYGGYTPLHIAAIHGQEEVIAQLVKDYSAKVNLRDYSGKKPYQYLKEGSSFAARHLLRDPDLHNITGHNTSIKKSAKVAASILSSTSTVLGLLSDDTAFYELTKGLKKPASFNKFLNATAVPRRKLKSRGTFSSYSSLSEAVEEEQEEATTKRRPMSELFFGH